MMGGSAPASSGDALLELLKNPEESAKRLEALQLAIAQHRDAEAKALEQMREAGAAEKRAAAATEVANQAAAHNKRVEDSLKTQREHVQEKAVKLAQREAELEQRAAELERAMAEREQAVARASAEGAAAIATREGVISERVEHVTVRENLAAAALDRAEKTRGLYEKKILELREIVNRGT